MPASADSDKIFESQSVFIDRFSSSVKGKSAFSPYILWRTTIILDISRIIAIIECVEEYIVFWGIYGFIAAKRIPNSGVLVIILGMLLFLIGLLADQISMLNLRESEVVDEQQ